MKSARVLAASLLALWTAQAGEAQKMVVDLVPDSVLQTRLEKGLVKTKARQAAVAELFRESGCQTEEQRVSKSAGNVICRLPGATDSTIIVGGHFDYIDRGQGIVDDWSGASLLSSLYEALKNKPRHHSYLFIAFAEEEIGLRGSTAFVKQLDKDKVVAFMNLECIGVGSPKVWSSRANPKLDAILRGVAKSVEVPLSRMDVDKAGDDDSHPFLNAKIPVITIHSLDPETLHVLHSSYDNPKAIQIEHYREAYKLAATFLAYLDNAPAEQMPQQDLRGKR